MDLQFGEVLDSTDHLRGVAVLVVIPADDLNLGAIDFGHILDHGLGGVEEGAVGHADDIGGHDLVFVVAVGLGGSCLHCGVDLLDGHIAFAGSHEDGGGTGAHGNALSGADEFAVEFGDDEADSLGGAGAVGHDVDCGGAGTTEVALTMRTVEDHLVAGVGVNGAHDTALDGSEFVERGSHGGEAVGGAGSCGNDGVFLGQGLLVDAVDDGGKVVAGGSGDDDFLCACVDVSLRFRLGGVEAGALEHDVHADLLPGKVSRVLLGVDLDLLAVHDDGAVLRFHFVGEGVLALRAVVFEKVREHLRIGEVVDGDDLVAVRREHLTECQTTDPTEAVDSNSNVLCHNMSPPKGYLLHPKIRAQSELSFRTSYILHILQKKHKRFAAKVLCALVRAREQKGSF